MDKRERQVREWAKNLPYLFASCGMANECEMAKDLVKILQRTEDQDKQEKSEG